MLEGRKPANLVGPAAFRHVGYLDVFLSIRLHQACVKISLDALNRNCHDTQLGTFDSLAAITRAMRPFLILEQNIMIFPLFYFGAVAIKQGPL
jgi:hypothetical protein